MRAFHGIVLRWKKSIRSLKSWNFWCRQRASFPTCDYEIDLICTKWNELANFFFDVCPREVKRMIRRDSFLIERSLIVMDFFFSSLDEYHPDNDWTSAKSAPIFPRDIIRRRSTFIWVLFNSSRYYVFEVTSIFMSTTCHIKSYFTRSYTSISLLWK